MDAGGYVIMLFIGAGLLFWGLWQLRSGAKEVDRIGKELERVGIEMKRDIEREKEAIRSRRDEAETDETIW